MRVVAFNCSPRKNGNTSRMINVVLEELEKEGISTELVQVGKKKIRGCIACYQCREKKDSRCHAGKEGDILNDCLKKMIEAQGIIIGSPTYFSNISTEAKALNIGASGDRASLRINFHQYSALPDGNQCLGGDNFYNPQLVVTNHKCVFSQ